MTVHPYYFLKQSIFYNELHHLLHYTRSGRRVLKNPSPNQLQLRLRTELEPRPAVRPALGDRPGSFSLLGQTSASMTDHSPSRSGRSSPASPTVSATLLRRSRCSGETLHFLKVFQYWRVFKICQEMNMSWCEACYTPREK